MPSSSIAPTLMNVPAADGSRYVSSSAVVATANVPAAKKPNVTSSVVRYPARPRDRANAAIVTGTRKLPTMITVGTRTLSSVTSVITAANTHVSRPPASSSFHNRVGRCTKCSCGCTSRAMGCAASLLMGPASPRRAGAASSGTGDDQQRRLRQVASDMTGAAGVAAQLEAARSQMAFTLGFHIILASLGVAFPALMLIANYRGLRKGDEDALLLARRWSKVVAVTFAVGAVTGTVLSFEFGLLWPEFTGRFGEVFGVLFAIEGIFFFLEAIFVAIYIFGWKRLRPWPHFWAGVPIVIRGSAGRSRWSP